jgi:hypothetical protein
VEQALEIDRTEQRAEKERRIVQVERCIRESTPPLAKGSRHLYHGPIAAGVSGSDDNVTRLWDLNAKIHLLTRVIIRQRGALRDQRALAIREKALGQEHLDVARAST